MCGIAGLIHKGKKSDVGSQMTSMLQALKHRGPDSTGYAIYGDENGSDLVMRIKVAEAEDMGRGSGIYDELERRIVSVDEVLSKHKVKVTSKKVKRRSNSTVESKKLPCRFDLCPWTVSYTHLTLPTTVIV